MTSNSRLRDVPNVEYAKLVGEALCEAVSRAIGYHRQVGNSVAVWRRNKVEWIPPDELAKPSEGRQGAPGGTTGAPEQTPATDGATRRR